MDNRALQTKIARCCTKGELPQFWIEESHDAIIDPQEWDAVQDEVKRRKAIGRAYSGNSILSAKLVCADCGSYFGPKTWHSNDIHKSVVWQCNAKFDKSKPKCETPHLREAEVKERFLHVYNGMLSDKAAVITAVLAAKKKVVDTADIDREMAERLRETEVVAELIRKCVAENCTTAQDQDDYTERYNAYVERYEKAKGRYDELSELRQERISKGKAIDRFLEELRNRDELLTEFDNCLWLTAVERVLVRRDGVLVFRFFDGREIEG